MSKECIGTERGDGNSCRCHTHRVHEASPRGGGKRAGGRAPESGAGERGSPRSPYSSGDDSTVRRTIRCVNPAIFVERLESSSLYDEDITPHPHNKSASTSVQSERSSNTSVEYITSKSCKLNLDTARSDACNDSETAREMQDTFRLSVSSRFTTDTERHAREDHESRKQMAFQEWLERKENEKREKVRRERERRESQTRGAERRRGEEAREATFRAWLHAKRTRAERERDDELARRQRVDHLHDEAHRKLQEKEDHLKEWARRKEEKNKESLRAEAERAAAAAEREQQRCELGAQAYRDWLRHSRHKPRPVPLNQGELSMRGSMAPMYVNPVPWQSII